MADKEKVSVLFETNSLKPLERTAHLHVAFTMQEVGEETRRLANTGSPIKPLTDTLLAAFDPHVKILLQHLREQPKNEEEFTGEKRKAVEKAAKFILVRSHTNSAYLRNGFLSHFFLRMQNFPRIVTHFLF